MGIPIIVTDADGAPGSDALGYYFAEGEIKCEHSAETGVQKISTVFNINDQDDWLHRGAIFDAFASLRRDCPTCVSDGTHRDKNQNENISISSISVGPLFIRRQFGKYQSIELPWAKVTADMPEFAAFLETKDDTAKILPAGLAFTSLRYTRSDKERAKSQWPSTSNKSLITLGKGGPCLLLLQVDTQGNLIDPPQKEEDASQAGTENSAA